MQLQVDSEAVSMASSQTQACTEEVRNQVSAMMANLVNLQFTWTDTASATSESLAQQWRATQTVVEDNLRQTGLQLTTVSQTYAQAEPQVAPLFAVSQELTILDTSTIPMGGRSLPSAHQNYLSYWMLLRRGKRF